MRARLRSGPRLVPWRCVVWPAQTFMYMRSCPEDNAYAHPLDMTPVRPPGWHGGTGVGQWGWDAGGRGA
jgi:hypothetical protein